MASSELRSTNLNKISIALQSYTTGGPTTIWPAWWREGVIIIAVLSNRRVLVPLPANIIFKTRSARRPHVRRACQALDFWRGCNVGRERETSRHGQATRVMEERDLARSQWGVQFLPFKDLHKYLFVPKSTFTFTFVSGSENIIEK